MGANWFRNICSWQILAGLLFTNCSSAQNFHEDLRKFAGSKQQGFKLLWKPPKDHKQLSRRGSFLSHAGSLSPQFSCLGPKTTEPCEQCTAVAQLFGAQASKTQFGLYANWLGSQGSWFGSWLILTEPHIRGSFPSLVFKSTI